MKKARYIRVSTGNQKTARQEIRAAKDELVFIDIISGATPFQERPEAKKLLGCIEKKEVSYLSVSSIDRLGRNLIDILKTLEYLNENRIVIKVDNLGIESMVTGKENSAFKLIISVMANISELERTTLLERQKEGIAIAKAKGVYKGREKGSVESPDVFLGKYKEVVKSLKKGNSLRDTAKICNVSLGTVQKVKKKIGVK